MEQDNSNNNQYFLPDDPTSGNHQGDIFSGAEHGNPFANAQSGSNNTINIDLDTLASKKTKKTRKPRSPNKKKVSKGPTGEPVIDPNSSQPINSFMDLQPVPADGNGEPESNVYTWYLDNGKYTMHKSELGNYNRYLIHNTGLHINNRDRVEELFKKEGIHGLFKLFYTDEMNESIRNHYNESLNDKKKEVTEEEFDAYIGLEVAMSFIKLTQIKDYWRKQMFAGQSDFPAVMSRDLFLRMKSGLSLKVDKKKSIKNPESIDQLQHYRPYFNNLLETFSNIAVPYGVSIYHERHLKGKARKDKKNYISPSDIKAGVYFDAITGWNTMYLYSLNDKVFSANLQGEKILWYANRYPELKARFINAFPELALLLFENQTIDIPDLDEELRVAVWTLQLAEQSLNYPSHINKKVVLTEHSFTSHTLAKKLLIMTNYQTRMIGGVELKRVEEINRPDLTEATKFMTERELGEWVLVAAYDKFDNPNAFTDPYQMSSGVTKVKSPNAGYIVFKNKHTILYTNDLAKTPSKDVLTWTDPEAIECVRGACTVTHIAMEKPFKRTPLKLPVMLVTYNMFMDGLDEIEQQISTSALKRKEVHEVIAFFLYIIDVSTQNAYSVYVEIMKGKAALPLKEFKRALAEALTRPLLVQKEVKKRVVEPPPVEPTAKKFGTTSTIYQHLERPTKPHLLVTNKDYDGARCHLCAVIYNGRSDTIYGCTGCRKGFHVDCYSAYHFPELIKKNTEVSKQIVEAAKVLVNRKYRALTSPYVNDVATFKLPVPKTIIADPEIDAILKGNASEAPNDNTMPEVELDSDVDNMDNDIDLTQIRSQTDLLLADVGGNFRPILPANQNEPKTTTIDHNLPVIQREKAHNVPKVPGRFQYILPGGFDDTQQNRNPQQQQQALQAVQNATTISGLPPGAQNFITQAQLLNQSLTNPTGRFIQGNPSAQQGQSDQTGEQ